MRGTFFLSLIGLIFFSNPVFAQVKDSAYYKGNLPLIIKTIRKINRHFAPDTDTTYSMLAIIEINTRGKLENLQVSSFKSSVLSDTIYNILLATKDDWVNDTGSNLFFELPVYITHIDDKNREDSAQIVKTILYHEGKMVNTIKLGPIICQIFPGVSRF